ALGVVKRELHEPRERHRAGRPDLLADPCGEPGVVGEVGQTRGGVTLELGSEAGHGRMLSTGTQGERETRSDERVTPEHDRDRRRSGRCGPGATPTPRTPLL